MDNRTMPEGSFLKSTMTDHEFAAFVRKYNAIHMPHLIGTVWSNHEQSVAVVIYCNDKPSREIWVKDNLYVN